ARSGDPADRTSPDAVDPTGCAVTAAVLAQAAVPRDIGVFEWLLDAESWTGATGILTSLWETVQLSFVVVAVAVVLTVPLGAWLAHRRRGEFAATWAVTLSRAIPTFAI